jgi:hypothetical protein
VEEEARKAIRDSPRESFTKLRVLDAEVSGLLAKIESLTNERRELAKRMEKIPVPDRRGNIPKIPG